MGRVFRRLGAVLALALVVATGAPMVDHAHADGNHNVFAMTSDSSHFEDGPEKPPRV